MWDKKIFIKPEEWSTSTAKLFLKTVKYPFVVLKAAAFRKWKQMDFLVWVKWIT